MKRSGASTTIPAGGSDPNAGFNGQQIFTAADSYTLIQPAPEPTSSALAGLSGGLTLLALRRRK